MPCHVPHRVVFGKRRLHSFVLGCRLLYAICNKFTVFLTRIFGIWQEFSFCLRFVNIYCLSQITLLLLFELSLDRFGRGGRILRKILTKPGINLHGLFPRNKWIGTWATLRQKYTCLENRGAGQTGILLWEHF